MPEPHSPLAGSAGPDVTAKGKPMEETSRPVDSSRRIDLTKETDVAYWCRIFDVDREQLREAVRHAGHQVDEVQRYLSAKGPGN